jgi:excisionase family DNA binding protein
MKGRGTMEDNKNQHQKILTLQEVADLLRVHPSTVTRFAKSGLLISYLIGSRRLFKESDVLAFFENQADRKYVFGKENNYGDSCHPKT